MSAPTQIDARQLNPAWLAFIKYCATLGHGELERVVIADGLPVRAELVKEKVKFA